MSKSKISKTSLVKKLAVFLTLVVGNTAGAYDIDHCANCIRASCYTECGKYSGSRVKCAVCIEEKCQFMCN